MCEIKESIFVASNFPVSELDFPRMHSVNSHAVPKEAIIQEKIFLSFAQRTVKYAV